MSGRLKNNNLIKSSFTTKTRGITKNSSIFNILERVKKSSKSNIYDFNTRRVNKGSGVLSSIDTSRSKIFVRNLILF